MALPTRETAPPLADLLERMPVERFAAFFFADFREETEDLDFTEGSWQRLFAGDCL